jgi:hypothetical protein
MSRARKLDRPDFVVYTPGHIGRGQGGKPTIIEGETGLPVLPAETLLNASIPKVGLTMPDEAWLRTAEPMPMPTGQLPVEGGGKFEPLPKWTEEDEL